MSDLLLDSTVVVDYLRGRTPAVDYLDLINRADVPMTHIVVVAEVIRGARDRRELGSIQTTLAPFKVLAPNEADAISSVDLLTRFRLSHGIGWPDCLIAATALRFGVAVVTTNVKHFAPIPNLRVVRPY
jgi:tRNA(fMet)-specific endonuclease VapC